MYAGIVGNVHRNTPPSAAIFPAASVIHLAESSAPYARCLGGCRLPVGASKRGCREQSIQCLPSPCPEGTCELAPHVKGSRRGSLSGPACSPCLRCSCALVLAPPRPRRLHAPHAQEVTSSPTLLIRALTLLSHACCPPGALHAGIASGSALTLAVAFVEVQNLNELSQAAESSRPAITQWSAEEEQLRESVSRFAKEAILPKVKTMDEKAKLDPEILQGCFAQGLFSRASSNLCAHMTRASRSDGYRNSERPQRGGCVASKRAGLTVRPGMNFTSSIIAVEELARVDPAVSVGMRSFQASPSPG